jgi:hypothetical protein
MLSSHALKELAQKEAMYVYNFKGIGFDEVVVSEV